MSAENYLEEDVDEGIVVSDDSPASSIANSASDSDVDQESKIASKKSTSVNNIALNHHRRRISSPAASSTSSNSNHHHHHHHLSRFLRTIGINRHSSSTAENAVKLTSVVTSIATDDDRRHGQCRFRDGNRVFGKDLIKHLKETGHEIPTVIRVCTECIEHFGMVDGIYRLSGISSNIRSLKNSFENSSEADSVNILEPSNLSLQKDIHSISSLLKLYCRELPDPLCTSKLYGRFLRAAKVPEEYRLGALRAVLLQLPEEHHRTLAYLMRHLCLVSKRGSETGMTAKNLAIVWAPNLLRRKEDFNNNNINNCHNSTNVGGNLRDVALQAACTEFLIKYCQVLFSEDDFPSSEAVDSLIGEAGFELGIEHGCDEGKEIDIDRAIAEKSKVTFAEDIAGEEAKSQFADKNSRPKRPRRLQHNHLHQHHHVLERSKSSVTLGRLSSYDDVHERLRKDSSAAGSTKQHLYQLKSFLRQQAAKLNFNIINSGSEDLRPPNEVDEEPEPEDDDGSAKRRPSSTSLNPSKRRLVHSVSVLTDIGKVEVRKSQHRPQPPRTLRTIQSSECIQPGINNARRCPDVGNSVGREMKTDRQRRKSSKLNFRERMKKRLASPTTTKQQHVTQVDHEFHEERVQNYDAKKEHDGDEVEVVVDGDVKARARIGAGGGGGLLQRVLLRKTSSQQQVYSSKVRMESRMASAAAATCYDEDDDNLEEGVVTIHQSRTKRADLSPPSSPLWKRVIERHKLGKKATPNSRGSSPSSLNGRSRRGSNSSPSFSSIFESLSHGDDDFEDRGGSNSSLVREFNQEWNRKKSEISAFENRIYCGRIPSYENIDDDEEEEGKLSQNDDGSAVDQDREEDGLQNNRRKNTKNNPYQNIDFSSQNKVTRMKQKKETAVGHKKPASRGKIIRSRDEEEDELVYENCDVSRHREKEEIVKEDETYENAVVRKGKIVSKDEEVYAQVQILRKTVREVNALIEKKESDSDKKNKSRSQSAIVVVPRPPVDGNNWVISEAKLRLSRAGHNCHHQYRSDVFNNPFQSNEALEARKARFRALVSRFDSLQGPTAQDDESESDLIGKSSSSRKMSLPSLTITSSSNHHQHHRHSSTASFKFRE